MTREKVVGRLGKSLAVTSSSGLETPRETWTYQLNNGRKVTLHLDSGIVTGGSNL